MANEIYINSSLVYNDAEGMYNRVDLADKAQTCSSKKSIKDRLTVTTSEVAIPLGGVTVLGWCSFKNLDPTNYIELLLSTGGSKFAKIPPGTTCGPIHIPSTCTAPYAIANTGTCTMEYVINST